MPSLIIINLKKQVHVEGSARQVCVEGSIKTKGFCEFMNSFSCLRLDSCYNKVPEGSTKQDWRFLSEPFWWNNVHAASTANDP